MKNSVWCYLFLVTIWCCLPAIIVGGVSHRPLFSYLQRLKDLLFADLQEKKLPITAADQTVHILQNIKDENIERYIYKQTIIHNDIFFIFPTTRIAFNFRHDSVCNLPLYAVWVIHVCLSATIDLCYIAQFEGNFYCNDDAWFCLLHTCESVNSSVLSKSLISILTKSCYMYAALTVSTCYTWSWTVYAVLCTRVEEIHTCLWSAKNRLSVAETNILFMYVWISNHPPTTKGKINPGMSTGASVLSKYEYDMGISWSNNILTPDNSMRLNW